MEFSRILSINPGSTSTKVAIYQQNEPVFLRTLHHTTNDLAQYHRITDQFEFRKNLILAELANANIDLSTICAVIGRGGLVHPIESGVYTINDKMLHDLRNSPFGEHASNLGGILAKYIANQIPNCLALIADPVVVDEMSDIAKIAGHPAFSRRSIFHALNQKAIARDHAKSIMKAYEELNLIVVHLGGGITIGAHQKGRVIDVNQGLDGEGPFSPERSGTLPAGQLVEICFAGQHTKQQIKEMITGKGGLVAYTGTNSAYEVEQRIKAGDREAAKIYEAMAYQVAKGIGEMFPVLNCLVDGILITGGIAYSKYFVNMVIERVHRLAPIYIYPGGDEMKALAKNALRVLTGETVAKEYCGNTK